MCCCGKAVINGEEGYSWDGKTFGVRKPFFAEMKEGDELIKDLPGRCGGVDSHSHDFRLVRRKFIGLVLLVRHGGGEDSVELHAYGAEAFIESMSDNDCYWIMRTIYNVAKQAARKGVDLEYNKWRRAAASGRIKTRKQRGTDFVKVWIVNDGIGVVQ
jgi:hypothetical protein